MTRISTELQQIKEINGLDTEPYPFHSLICCRFLKNPRKSASSVSSAFYQKRDVMKRTYCFMLICLAWLVPGLLLQAASQTFISGSVRYDLFYNDLDPESSGAEVTVPLGIAYRQKRFSLSLETACANANVSWSDGTDAKLSGLTDTLLSASYSYVFPGRPMALMFGLDMSLPTGKENFREGQRLVFGGNVRITSARLGGSLSLQYTMQSKNEVSIEETLQEEEQNSNGSEFFGLAALSYLASPKLTVRLQGDIRYYGESEAKNEGGLPFFGQRLRYAADPGFSYRLNKQLSVSGLFKGFIMNQERDQFEEEDVGYYGANLDLGFRYVF